MPRPLVPHRRERILEAARALLHENGWDQTRVSEIAALAGISKGAVYLEFETKTEMLDALILESTRRLISEVRARVEQTDGLLDLPQAYRFGVEALLADPLMSALYLGQAGVLGDHMKNVPHGRYQQRIDWLGEYVRDAQHAGLIAENVDPGSLVHLLATYTVGLVHSSTALGERTAADLSTSVALFADILERGLAASHPADPVAARGAHLRLLQRLDHQLTELERAP